jgi:hypothetical protein
VRASRRRDALEECSTNQDNPDTCAVCRMHFRECEADERCVGDDDPKTDIPVGREPACPGARARRLLASITPTPGEVVPAGRIPDPAVEAAPEPRRETEALCSGTYVGRCAHGAGHPGGCRGVDDEQRAYEIGLSVDAASTAKKIRQLRYHVRHGVDEPIRHWLLRQIDNLFGEES